jgi:hypothetical protein
VDNLQDIAQLNALSKLRDIRMPAPIGWWPLAPGWYLFILIVVLLGVGLTIVSFRNYPFWRVKRQALGILSQYEDQYLLDQNSQEACATVSELLKKVALAYYPRELVASLYKGDWLTFLNRTLVYTPWYKRVFSKIFCKKEKSLVFNSLHKELLEYPYQESQLVDLDLLFSSARMWIKNQKRLKNKIKEHLCLN